MKTRIIIVLVCVAAALAGCGSQTTATEPAAGLTVEQLGNATYQGIYEDPVTLIDGVYEGEPFDGGASRPTVTLDQEHIGTGDLDRGNVPDSAVILAENSGGTGVFMYLAAVLNKNGSPENIDTTLLGDRVQINAVRIEDNTIVVEGLTFAPEDPQCCPSREVIWKYGLQEGQLVEEVLVD